jgi:glyoxylase-like metal-dependent hydrolase (beta-lactamase superfamily II)
MTMLARRLGDIELIVMSDGLLRSPADRMVDCDHPELAGQFLRPDEHGDIWLGLNCVVIRSGSQVILVDTGFGDGPLGADPDLVRKDAGLSLALRLQGIDRGEVKLVVNTHLHDDHAGGNLTWEAGNPRPAFVNASYLVQRDERDFALSGHLATEGLYTPDDVRALDVSGQLRTHVGDVQIAPGISVKKAPGHTPGHQIVVVESRDETVAVTGDLAPMALHFRHPDWKLRGDFEPSIAVSTRQAIVDWATARSACVVPYHEPDQCWAEPGPSR